MKSEQSELDKFNQLLKEFILQNPDVRTTLSLIEKMAKHGAFKASFIEMKTSWLTGEQEMEIEAGKRCQNIEMLLLATKGA
jgi:hypothetical protein